MWTGIMIGILIMMISHYVVNVIVAFRARKYNDSMMEIMTEGNALRKERNELLDRIAGIMGCYEGVNK